MTMKTPLIADAQTEARLTTDWDAALYFKFGAERARPGGPPLRADRVVAWHDTPSGRYLHLVKPSSDGRAWSTITPIDNVRLAGCVWELLNEV